MREPRPDQLLQERSTQRVSVEGPRRPFHLCRSLRRALNLEAYDLRDPLSIGRQGY